ncbi:hypothetical protein ROLI_032110 [Roseobacter fucihabitans]|uniref:Uncharacterized protein n=1 Tax=Roseobacter fucihabitans TaxID=1537242 RepID=A0ABZ2BXC0_9RHOB|nr:hypothetical protein [Roseobacter litoralis]
MRYRQRAKLARSAGRVLMFLTAMLMSAALWSDPALQPRLSQALKAAPAAVANAAQQRATGQSARAHPGANLVAAAAFDIENAQLFASTPSFSATDIDR